MRECLVGVMQFAIWMHAAAEPNDSQVILARSAPRPARQPPARTVTAIRAAYLLSIACHRIGALSRGSLPVAIEPQVLSWVEVTVEPATLSVGLRRRSTDDAHSPQIHTCRQRYH